MFSAWLEWIVMTHADTLANAAVKKGVDELRKLAKTFASLNR